MFMENQNVASCAAIVSGSLWMASYSETFQRPFELVVLDLGLH